MIPKTGIAMMMMTTKIPLLPQTPW